MLDRSQLPLAVGHADVAAQMAFLLLGALLLALADRARTGFAGT
jgi:hypothetical protein